MMGSVRILRVAAGWTPVMTLMVAVAAQGSEEPSDVARQILQETGIGGGLVVHLDCGDGRLTTALRAGEGFLVHGLDRDVVDVEKARATIRDAGAYGPVSVDHLTGRVLPYTDNLINLLASEDLGDVPMNEVLRVLVPHGIAHIKRDGKWVKTVKPRPENIDDWTHYLHDATNNAVAQDTVVGPPKRYQWHGSPRWSRHHDHMASMSALVSANGRLFYIFDEGSTASILLPSQWFLTGRDAFNGTILWKRPIDNWHTHLWPLKSGPADLPRRLVAVGDRVYVTLGFDAPVSMLDAATGETIRTYEQTAGTEEILCSGGVLFLVVGKPDTRDRLPTVAGLTTRQSEEDFEGANRTVMAVQAETGEVLWQKASQVIPLTLTADSSHVFFCDGDKVICLDCKTGEQQWASESLPRAKKFTSEYAPTLVVHDGVVLFAGGKNVLRHYGAQDSMQALSAENGKVLWTAEHPPSGYDSPEDIFVAGGLVWTGATAQSEDSGEFTGRDLHTGEVRKHFIPVAKRGYGHHRCYRAKATERYILTSRSGIEYLDMDSMDFASYRWIRGACLYGIMACNGLVYAPPHDCACDIEGKLYAFSAVASDSTTRTPPGEVSDEGRLQKGPAYGKTSDLQPPASSLQPSSDWPMYRYDTTRSGHTKTAVPADVKQAWQADVGGRLSAPVVAEGKVFVASIDCHTVHALDAASGKETWSYTAGGRVDSPPAIWQGRVLFGSADGWVYCLRADDGRLAWRFRAAPEDRRMTAFEQVESVWPVSGSVLVRNGTVYCVAGRVVHLDGGLRLLRLDATTGRKLSETILNQSNNRVQVGQPDILTSDGKHVYMKSLRFDMDGAYRGIPTRDVTQQFAEDAHLFSPTSFLDDSWWHRSYWIYGRRYAPGAMGYPLAGLMAPGGRILTVDDSTVYGFGRKDKYYRWTTPLEHVLFAADKERGDFEPLDRRGRTTSIQVAPSESFDPGNRPMTVEAWVNSQTGNGVVVARGGGKSDGFALLIESGKPKFVVRTGKQLTTVDSKENVLNQWTHLAGVQSAEGKIELYVNGSLIGAAQAPSLPKLDPTAAVDIGLDSGAAVGDYRAPLGFRGLMDEVRIYDGVLTAEQICQHATDPGKTDGRASLVLHYPFDKEKWNPRGEGKVTDNSGKGNDGATVGLRSDHGHVGRAGKFIGAKPGLLRLPFAVKHRWAQEIPLFVRAMVLADKTLFIAGPPDLVDEEKVTRALIAPDTRKALAEQRDALDGKKGALLWAVSASDGKRLAEQNLAAMPVFDGMIAAAGRIYYTTTDGRIIALGGKP